MLTCVHDQVFKRNEEKTIRSDESVIVPENHTSNFDFNIPDVSYLTQSRVPPFQKKPNPKTENAVVEFPTLRALFDVKMDENQPSSGQFPVPELRSSIPSSTPVCKNTASSRAVATPLERQVYRRLLNEASISTRPRVRVPAEELTIVIDDAVESNQLTSLKRCSLSPINVHKDTVQIQSTSHTPVSNAIHCAQAIPVANVSTESDAVDREARTWLKTCERTPFLSSDWLNHLTVKYRDRADQRARERELAEAKLRHYEKQRELSHRVRMENLEQRLACLLLTPPVLADPYLVPHPIPIELPYKPLRQSVPPALPELSEAQWAEVSALLRSGAPGDVLVENFRLSVTRKELLTLTASNWLSDMVINFYMQLLYHRSQNQPENQTKRALPRIAVLTTFFYPKLTSTTGGGYSGVRRWSRNLKLLDQDLILIPIHDRGMHWCLACIDLRSKTIQYYDSMGSGNDKCLQCLKSYLQDECNDKKGYPLPEPDSWKLINTEDSVPQQMNGSDCGVFMCTYAEFLSRSADFTFTQSDMPGIRKRMIYEILNQRLLTTGFQVKTS